MKKKILVSIAVFVLFFVAGTILKAKAETPGGASGWLWGGSEDASIGPANGMIDGNETGVGYISMSGSAQDGSSYGVTVDGNGNLDGYAWSDNIGWISFVDGDLNCNLDTDIPDCAAAKVVNNSKVTGYARILGIKNAYETGAGNSGGWKGYIKFMDASINPSTGEFDDDAYAWNGEVAKDPITDASNPNSVKEGLGWISLKGAKIPCVESKHYEWVPVDPCSSGDENICGAQTIKYKCSLTGQSCGHWTPGYTDEESLCESEDGEKPKDIPTNCGTCNTSGKWKETKPQQ